MISRVNNNGFNVPSYQASTEYPDLRHEYITIPPTSTPSFGAYSVFDFREKSLLLHEIILQYVVPPIPLQGTDTYARLSPAFFFFSRIELVLNNQIIDTIYSTEQFVKSQLFITDEKRKALNYSIGDYLNLVQRNNSFTAGKTYYVPLHTFFNVSNMPMLYPKDDLQIRLYSNTLSNVIYSPHNLTYSPPQGFTCNLIA